MKVKLISVTPKAEKLIGYCARVSNPKNQNNSEVSKLLTYCLKNQHWSVFEMADMTIEITTSRAIAAQILRHRSFNFQEFSQRYAEATEFEIYESRRQDTKNRQNSIDDLDAITKEWFIDVQMHINNLSKEYYRVAIKEGIAKEQARFLLPLSTQTKLYMKGNLRSWIHYLQLRTANGTQKEHQEIANAIKLIFTEQFPIISKALEWN